MSIYRSVFYLGQMQNVRDTEYIYLAIVEGQAVFFFANYYWGVRELSVWEHHEYALTRVGNKTFELYLYFKPTCREHKGHHLHEESS